jgi:probable O-glycosylation ligase (exosortase A-associated)
MIRTLLVTLIICIGFYFSLHSAFYGLLLYMWNAYFRPEEWLWSTTLRRIHLSFIIGSYVVLTAVIFGNRLIFNRKVCLLLIFSIQASLSTLYSQHLEYSWPFFVEFLKLLAICYMMFVLIDDFQKFRICVLIIVLSLSFEASKQGWYYLLTSPGWPNPNPLPFLGDNNGVAVGMLMLIPSIVLLAQTTQRSWIRPFYWIILIGILYRAISTFSRGGFIACIFMTLLFWIYSSQRIRLLLIILPFSLIIGLSLPDTFWDRMSTITTYQEDNDPSALGRLHYWEVASIMAQNNPILGIGFNAFNDAYDRYDFSKGRYGFNRSVHNSFFGVLAELGYVGLALYLLILALALMSCHHVIRMARDHRELSDFAASARAFEISLIVFIIGGSFLAFQYFEMLWHYITLCYILEYLALAEVNRLQYSPAIEQPSYPM